MKTVFADTFYFLALLNRSDNSHSKAVQFTSAHAVRLLTTEWVMTEAVRLYSERLDKQWSLTDCTPFVAMQNNSVTEALTGDHHFEQAGFVALLK